jgi:glucosylglycerol-phosphate synthase
MAQVGSVLHEPQMVDELAFDGRRIAIDSIPLGINTPLFRRIRELASTQRRVERIRSELAVDTVLFSVGRVDYTKGTGEMLAAYERLLQRRPELRGHIKLCVTSVAPANDIDVYEDVQREIEQRVGAINGQYSTLSWSPVLLFTQPIGLEDLVAWYRAADICWITPLRDGLNLVAKEFVLSKGGEGGVLILSDFAGCVVEMDEALHCNPYSTRSMDTAIDRALSMPADDIRRRAHEMYRRISRNSIALWTTEMLDRLGLRAPKK